MKADSGRVSKLLRPSDVHDLVKLCRVLAAVLADDGCIPAAERRALAELAAQLESITTSKELSDATKGRL